MNLLFLNITLRFRTIFLTLLLLLFLHVVPNNGYFVIFLLNSTPIIFFSLWAFLLGGNPGVLDTKAVQVLFLGYGIQVPHVSVCLCLLSCVDVNSPICFVFSISYIYHHYYHYFLRCKLSLFWPIKASSSQLLWPIDLTLLIFEQFFCPPPPPAPLTDFLGLPCSSLLQTYDQPCL